MRSGFDRGTASTTRLVTKAVDLGTRETAIVISVGDADAKTSTGAPATNCVANVDEEANENCTLVPGCVCSKDSPSKVKVPVRLEAAKTVRVPTVVGGGEDVCDGANVKVVGTITK